MYDFETVVDRRAQGSKKWLIMKNLKADVCDDCMPFSVADMEFKTAPPLVEGLKACLDEMVLGYTVGNEAYYKAVKSWMKRHHDFDVESDWIVNFQAIVSAIYTAIEEFTEPGDGIIVMPPVYYPFFMVIESLGRKIVECPLIKSGDSYEIDFDLFEELIAKPENKALLFCSPHNPVGRVWKREELQRLADGIIKNDKLLFADEIHNDLIMPGHKHTVFQTLSEDLADRAITFTSASKTFNVAGMDLCTVFVKNPAMRERYVNRAVCTSRISPTALGFKTVELCYDKCEDWYQEMMKKIEENSKYIRDYMAKNHPEIKIADHQGTYLLWLDFNALGMDHEALEKHMIKHDLFLDEGYIFGKGGQGFERINLASPTRFIEDLCKKITVAIEDAK